MLIEIGQVEAIFRYPVKSMRGEPLKAADLGWHGTPGSGPVQGVGRAAAPLIFRLRYT